jgi:NDP-sugar pyrophosphorylase family protein
MILAAGLGTRLRPLTSERPKALVEIRGRTLLEIALERLRGFGIDEVIVNVHHFAGMVEEYLKAHDDFGMRIEISREAELLDTGGGLKQAAEFFLREAPDAGDARDAADRPFVVHNVDVLSSIDLAEMVKFHGEQRALATLAVQQRASSRQLLFDERGQLCGRGTDGGAEAEMVCPAAERRPLAFTGIHVISPRIFGRLVEQGAFPIVPAYLRLAGEGEKIVGYRADHAYWRDLGTAASLQQAADDMERKVIAG